MQPTHDLERMVEFEFLRATENAALHSMHWMGRGDKEAADEAACDAIKGMFDLVDIRGEVVIGEDQGQCPRYLPGGQARSLGRR